MERKEWNEMENNNNNNNLNVHISLVLQFEIKGIEQKITLFES